MLEEVGPYLKVIICSRPDNNIKNMCGKLLTIWPTPDTNHLSAGENYRLEVEPEDTEHDLRLVIEYDLEELAQQGLLSPRTKDMLHKLLSASAGQTFLWVSLIMTLITEATENGASEHELISLLDDKSIDSLYAKFLDKCLQKEGIKEKAQIVLQILVAAKRPLSVFEIDVALSIRTSSKCLDDLRPYLHVCPENYVRQLCGHLVKCRQKIVYFVHQTAKEFLICHGLGAETNVQQDLGPLYHSIQLPVAHAILSDICCQYLFFADFQDVPEDFAHTPWASGKVRARYCEDRPLLHYAASSWHFHVRQSDQALTPNLSARAWQLCDTRTTRFWIWFYLAGYRWAKSITSETTAAEYLGLGTLRPIHESNQSSSHRRSLKPLNWALAENKASIVGLLYSLAKGFEKDRLSVFEASNAFYDTCVASIETRQQTGIVRDYDTEM